MRYLIGVSSLEARHLCGNSDDGSKQRRWMQFGNAAEFPFIQVIVISGHFLHFLNYFRFYQFLTSVLKSDTGNQCFNVSLKRSDSCLLSSDNHLCALSW